MDLAVEELPVIAATKAIPIAGMSRSVRAAARIS
jgi:hypothetical protein